MIKSNGADKKSIICSRKGDRGQCGHILSLVETFLGCYA